MPAAKPTISVERLRSAVARSVKVTSLREVARGVGMSPSGLRKFLDGAEPYSATRSRLESWFIREQGGRVSTDAAVRALQVLVADLPPSAQPETIEALLSVLGTAHKRHGISIAEWRRAVEEPP
jgi:hypothetical protein